MAETVADLEKKYLLTAAPGAVATDTLADLNRKFYNPGVRETTQDAKRRVLLAGVSGALATDTMADLERKQALSYHSITSSSLSTQDLMYARYTGLTSGPVNLLTTNQASVETDLTGFMVETNCTIARSTVQAAHGSASLAMTAVGAGSTYARVGGTGLAKTPVVAGRTYTAVVSFRAATTARQVSVAIAWAAAAGGYLSEVSNALSGEVTTGWMQVAVTAVAPPTAGLAYLLVGALAAAISEVHYADQFGLWEGTGGSWVMPL